MPIYEYRCGTCRRTYSFLVRNIAAHRPPACPRCGRKRLERVISSFRIGRSEESRLDRIADPSVLSGLDENDPRSLARMMRKMGGELGEEMPEEMGEMCDRLEAGESPEEIERTMEEGGGPGADELLEG
ncbi:MAG: zinc ribbon domain-containing protein [bacterium]|nr:zinc ribbon domain-containing protein [bacterium]